ncbi:MAG: hypothetical protein ACLP6W_17310 [Bryobacteraceae bacterium]
MAATRIASAAHLQDRARRGENRLKRWQMVANLMMELGKIFREGW